MIEIRSRFGGQVLHAAETAQDVRAAVVQAVAAKSNLAEADLYGANLAGAYLSGANLRDADLRKAYLSGANLRAADLRWAYLREADLYGANLSGANLSGANLRDAGILHVEGLPSGSATLTPDPDGWVLQIGCWRGTTTDLREMIDYDDGWPDAEGTQIVERRPMLTALADMCDAWAESHSHLLAAVQETHCGKSD